MKHRHVDLLQVGLAVLQHRQRDPRLQEESLLQVRVEVSMLPPVQNTLSRIGHRTCRRQLIPLAGIDRGSYGQQVPQVIIQPPCPRETMVHMRGPDPARGPGARDPLSLVPEFDKPPGCYRGIAPALFPIENAHISRFVIRNSPALR